MFSVMENGLLINQQKHQCINHVTDMRRDKKQT